MLHSTAGCSWCILLTVAVAGLTDEVKLPPREYPIELPAGTIWHDSAAADQTSEATETRSYDLSPYIDRLREDEPNFLADMAAENVRQQFESMLRPFNSADRTNDSGLNPINSEQSPCKLFDRQLVIQATATQHDRIASLLSRWVSQGQQQISIEFRTWTTRRQLSQLLPASGGRVINSKPIIHRFDAPLSFPAPTEPQMTSRIAEQSPSPVLVQVLTPPEAFHLVSNLWPEGTRVSVLFAPKVTIFEGSTATIADRRIRPFATGFLTVDSGTLEPRISTVEDGFRFHTFASVESGKTHLSVGCHMSQILDVEVRKMRADSKELNIQIPKVRETLLEATAELNDGETLLLVPLLRNEDGDLTMFLITPRILDVHEEEEELDLGGETMWLQPLRSSSIILTRSVSAILPAVWNSKRCTTWRRLPACD